MSLAKLITNCSIFSSLQKVPVLTLSTTKAFSTCESAHKKHSDERLDVPEPPQMPIRPYNKFIKENKDFMSHLPWNERRGLLGEKYEQSSSEEKSRRMKEFADEKIEYQQNYKTYVSSLTPEQAENLKNKVPKTKEKSKKQLKTEQKVLEKSLGKPSRPVNGFVNFWLNMDSSEKQMGISNKFSRFLGFEQPSVGNMKKYTIKEAGELWKLKSERERNELNAKYLKEVEHYKHKLLQWEEKMFNEGRDDLIRKSSPVFKKK